MTLVDQAHAIKPYFWANQRPDLKLYLITAVVCLVLAKISNLATPWLLGLTIDTLNGENVVPPWVLGIVGLVVVYALSRFFSLVFSELREVLFTHVSQHAIRVLTRKTFTHLHELPLAFHLSRYTGSLDRLIDRGTKAIDFLLRYVVFNIAPTFIELAIVGVIIWSLFGWVYALIITFTMLAYIVLTLKITSWRLRFRREMNSADNTVAGRMVDSFVNVENVRLFNNEKFEADRVDIGLADYERAANQSRWSLMCLNLSQMLLVLVGVVAVLVIAALEVEDNVLTVGGFVTLNTYILQAFQPLNSLGYIYRNIRQSLIDMENLLEVLCERAEVDLNCATDSLKDCNIVFEDVRFSYHSDRQIIDDISFRIEKGESVALVGETGSGKTTIGKLVLKIIEPTDGQIILGDYNLNRLSRRVVRNAIGVVPQETVLFNDTLGNNIRYGRINSNDSEVTHAAHRAGLGHFLEVLPEGLDTEVGARGLKLSGGEKQRIAIARVILKNPEILIFDEATSSLDVATERQIQRNLENISKGRTTLIITHRLSTIRNVDRIMLIKAGQLSESGSFRELMDKDGEFRALWESQQHADAKSQKE